MYKVAVVGDRDSIYGFSASGIEIFSVLDNETAIKTVRTLAENDYAVIYITEALFTSIKPHLEEYESTPLPAIIPIPGVRGNTGIGVSQVKKMVERAVGSDILFGDE